MSDDIDVTTRSEDPPQSLDALDTAAASSVDGGGGEHAVDGHGEGDGDSGVEGEGTEGGDEGGTDEGDEGGAGGEAEPRSGGSRVRLLEREGEVAADFLERLLDIADLDGDIEVDIDGDRASVAIVDSEDGRVPRRLVGAEGKVLDALQELTRLAVQAETGERSRLMLDVAGHRAQRRAAVLEIARTAVAEVKTTGAQKALDDMSAFERKIVHDEVAAAGLGSESEGVEPHRHIVVFPA
jgi:spoIIIJ-associated protein